MPNITTNHAITYTNTRFSVAGSFYLQYSRTDHLKYSFSSIGAKIWNTITNSDRALPKYKFKDILPNRLLDILTQENTL